MVQHSDQLRVKCLLTEAITLLCKTGLTYSSRLSVEGLLGITLDSGDIFLVNINETVHSDAAGDQQMAPVMYADSQGLLSAPDVASEVIITEERLDEADTDVGDVISQQLQEGAGLDDHEGAGLHHETPLEDERLDNGVELHEDVGLHDHEGTGLNTGTPIELITERADLSVDTGLALDYTTLGDDCGAFTDAIFGGTGKSRGGKLGLMDVACDLSTSVVFNSEDIASLLQKVAPPGGDEDNYGMKVECFERGAAGAAAVESVLGSWEAALQSQQDDMMPLNLAGDAAFDEAQHSDAKRVGGKVCDSCGKWYRSKQGLKKHKCMPSLTGKPGAEVPQPLDLTMVRAAGGATYCCEACTRSFPSYTACIAHHCAPWKVCETCGARLRSQSGYEKHKRRHAGSFKLHCSLCHKGFFDRTHLRAHMDAAHSKVRRHTCECCRKSFFWKHHLKRHLVHCGRTTATTVAVGDEVTELMDV